MAATMGLVPSSKPSITSGKPGSCSGLPNSRISAPAGKVRPSAIIITANCIICHALGNALLQAFTHSVPKRVYRGEINTNNGNVAINVVVHCIIHVLLLVDVVFLCVKAPLGKCKGRIIALLIKLLAVFRNSAHIELTITHNGNVWVVL